MVSLFCSHYTVQSTFTSYWYVKAHWASQYLKRNIIYFAGKIKKCTFSIYKVAEKWYSIENASLSVNISVPSTTHWLHFLDLYKLSNGVALAGCLPCVPVAAVGAVKRGLAGGVCPRLSGPAAPTGDERTCWHSRFLYRQEVGGAAEQMPYIIGRIPEPATCRQRGRARLSKMQRHSDIV